MKILAYDDEKWIVLTLGKKTSAKNLAPLTRLGYWRMSIKMGLNMFLNRLNIVSTMLACLLALASCSSTQNATLDEDATRAARGYDAKSGTGNNGSILDAFRDKGRSIKVNRFLWTATLETLDFLPLQSADPYTGVIITGYGRPPGGATAYKATVLISDPALDARSLNVALQTSNGQAVAQATRNAVEDAILTRARQLRTNAGRY